MTNWADSDVANIKELYTVRAHVTRRRLTLMDGTHLYDYGLRCNCDSTTLRAYSFQTVDSAIGIWVVHALNCPDAKDNIDGGWSGP